MVIMTQQILSKNLFKHPFTCIIAGPTSSGKTHFVQELLNENDVIVMNVSKKIRRNVN